MPSTADSTETNIFDLLPGQVLPVGEISPTLSAMWAVQPGTDNHPASEFRASQMNLILHIGLRTPPEEVKARFDTLVSFAQKYPCRLIILCPMGRERSERLMEGKLFSQCYIGPGMREMCCIEAIIVGYPTREAGFITNTVSVWLENDLPTYHWFNRVPAERISENHMEFVKYTTRVVYDSSIETEDLGALSWPKPETAIDLAYARILPARQSIGQFLSATSPADLASGLKQVTVRHSASLSGEGKNLLAWCQERLKACAQASKSPLQADFILEKASAKAENCLELEWTYEDNRHFLWTHKTGCDEAAVTADFGHGRVSAPSQVAFLDSEKALSEAIFFA